MTGLTTRLSKLQWSVWQYLRPDDTTTITGIAPTRPGVYLLAWLRNGEHKVHYVGSSGNLADRLQFHSSTKQEDNPICLKRLQQQKCFYAYAETPEAEIRATEQELIDLFGINTLANRYNALDAFEKSFLSLILPYLENGNEI